MIVSIAKIVRSPLKKVVTAVLWIRFILAMTSATAAEDSPDRRPLRNLRDIKHIIVIYQENWSFDGLYGLFPGANGYANSFDTLPQLDVKADPPYSSLIYQTPSPLTGSSLASDLNFPSVGGKLALASNHNLALPLIPYDLTKYIAANALTGDIVHRFYHEQLQIDNGMLESKDGDLDKFVTWSDNPGLVLSYIDATNLPEGRLAQQYTLCDNFFRSAYGGSFLNHQWLIAVASPPWTTPIPDGWQSSYDPVAKVLKDNQLTIDGKYAIGTVQPLLAPFSPGTPTTERLLINNTDPSQPGSHRILETGLMRRGLTGDGIPVAGMTRWSTTSRRTAIFSVPSSTFRLLYKICSVQNRSNG
jgi:phospholipase C